MSDIALEFLAGVLSPEFRDDPYPFYHRLRATAPVLPTPFGVWVVSTHADVRHVLQASALSSDPANSTLSWEPPTSPRAVLGETSLLFMDPPDHTRIRRLVAGAFTMRSVQRLQARMEGLVDDLIERCVTGGTGMDVIEDLAVPLPVTVICEMLGVPLEARDAFRDWSRELAGSMDPQLLRAPGQDDRFHSAAAQLSEFFTDLIAFRRRAPQDDLLSELIAVEHAGDKLSAAELLSTGIILLVAGHETSVNLIGNGLLALLRNRDELARLRRDPAVETSFVDELLRYDSPIQMTRRITVDDYALGDATVPAGNTIVALIGAANRDPLVFDEPDRLDLGRPNAHSHVALGIGAHHCVGAALGRKQADVALTTLARRFPDMELAAEPVRGTGLNFRGYEHLLVDLG